MKKLTDAEITAKQEKFLNWLFQTYGQRVDAAYRKIAKDKGDMCYIHVRQMLFQLEESGLLVILNKGTRRPSYLLNTELIAPING